MGTLKIEIVLEKTGSLEITTEGEIEQTTKTIFNPLTTQNTLISKSDLLKQIGNVVGYSLKNIIIKSSDTSFAQVKGTKPNFSIQAKKAGSFSASIIIEKNGVSDITLNARFTIEKNIAPTNLRFQQLDKKYDGSDIDKTTILHQLQGTKDGYTLKSITAKSGYTNVLSIIGSAPNFKLSPKKAGTIVLSIVIENPLKKDKALDFRIEISKGEAAVGIRFTRIVKPYIHNGSFTQTEIEARLTNSQISYTLKEIKNLSNDIVIINSDKKNVSFNNKLGVVTADLVLENPLYKEVTVKAQFEVRIGVTPVLTFNDLTKKYSSSSFTQAEIESNVLGTKAGYTLKQILNVVPSSLANVTNKTLTMNKIGRFTATLVLEHSLKLRADAIIQNARFEVTKSDALGFKVSDPLYKDQWYLKNTGQFGGTSGIDIKIEPVWNQGYHGQDINIGILDTSIGLSKGAIHEDLKDNINVVKSHNYLPYSSYDHHGTKTAGIIAAMDNDIGIRGIAFKSQLYVYGTTEKNLNYSNIVKAIDKYSKEIAVYNFSWGEETVDMNTQFRNVLDKGLGTGFYGKGAVYVMSSGNDAYVNTGHYGKNAYYGAVFVNSLDPDGINTKRFKNIRYVTPFDGRSIGPSLWISAPGYKLRSTGSYKPNEKYGFHGMTSAAAPVVTGVVALIREVNKNLTWRDVKLILAESATKNDSNHLDWKMVNKKRSNSFENFYFSHYYGFGMVNAQKAIELSKKWTNLPPMKKEIFSNENLNMTIDSNVRDNTITIKNSTINFIESVVIELDLEKKVNVENTNTFDLKLKNSNLSSHLYMEGKMFRASKTLYHNKDRIKLKMLTNMYLGGKTIGHWKIEIRDEKIFTKLKGWKMIIRGY